MTYSPTGAQHELRAGSAAAVVTEVGGGLRALRVGGRDVVAGFAADRPRPLYRGSVLAPWPNRVGGGRYRWAGQEHHLPLTEPERGNALHGLACFLAWTPTARDASSLTLATRIWPQPGYPFQLDLSVTYRVDADGLFWQLSAHNSGPEPAPYGCAVHPYLLAGTGRPDDWTLTLPADRWLDVDSDRLLPVGLHDVAGTALDFRSPSSLRSARLDTAFTGLRPDGDGLARVVLSAADGGTAVEWDPNVLPWVQVFTSDRPEPELHRAAVAIEPMTCPPDAFRSGDGVIRLEPGETHTAWWRIRAL